MRQVFLIAAALGTPILAHGEAATTAPSPTSESVYTPADFAQFAPRTALDMVSQIPGFSVSGGNDDDERGFGQATENVLINGRRISSKSTSARDALSRIPAANVEKIEIVEGASLDIPGLSGQVANVTAKADGISGTWTYRHRYREDLPPAYDWFEASVNGEKGNLSWTLGLESEPTRGAASGREHIVDGTGQLFELRDEAATYIGSNPELTGSLSWKPANGHVLNLNAEYSEQNFNESQYSNRSTPDETEFRRTRFLFAEDSSESELSGDYEFGLGPGRLKFIALRRDASNPTQARAFGADLDGTDPIDSIFDRTVDENESILRSEYSWSNDKRQDWQISLEGAFNQLESSAALRELDPAIGLVPIDIGDPDIVVEEKRAEMFVTHGRQLSPKVRLQVSLGVEQSEIMSDGANAQTRNFTRPKGSISTAWEVSDTLTINTKIERDVGQLDFFDFVSNIDVEQGDDQNGNVDIVPEQSWRGEIQVERNFGDWGAVTATVFGEALEDIADQVPIGTGEGPGNLESGSRYGLEVDGTLKFDKLGWKGAQLELSGEYQKSEVDDPLTGEARRINGDLEYFIEAEFRHDIPNTDWAWGFTFERFQEAPVFRLDAERSFEATPGFAWAFIEHKDIYGMTGSVFLANLTDQSENFTRTQYTPNRNGAIERIEDRSRTFGPILTLRLKGSF